ncbi:hypothetical protein BDV18DRAFT_80739 [Aspergillus unguis]
MCGVNWPGPSSTKSSFLLSPSLLHTANNNMPLEILEGEPPEPPAWGTLALDIYLLSELDTPHGQDTAESVPDRYRQLVRQFLALGSMGRLPYNLQTEDPPTPTDAQITEILRPVRPEALRPYAEYTGSLDEGLYVRLCYNTETEEAHEAVWAGNLSSGFVGPDGILFDDEGILQAAGAGMDLDLAGFLEIFPERVTNSAFVEHVEHRGSVLRDALSERDTDHQGEEGYSKEVKRYLAERRVRDPLLQYWEYHAACAVTHLFIEDREALDGNGLLHVFLDDTGNVVRQWRSTDNGDDFDFDGSWKEGVWKGDFENGRGELGATYQEGGTRGPPYEL